MRGKLRMKRKIISMLMAMVILLTTVDVSVFASEAKVSENGLQSVVEEESNYEENDDLYSNLESVSENKIGEETISDNDIENGEETISDNDIENGEETISDNDIENEEETISGNDIENEEETISDNDIENEEETISNNDIGNGEDTVSDNETDGTVSGNEMDDKGSSETYPADDSTWAEMEQLGDLGEDLTGGTMYSDSKEEQKVEAPIANIEAGAHINEETVIRLTAETLDSKIYYTTDGTEPIGEDNSPRGKLYTDGIKAKKVMMAAEDPEIVEKVVIIKAYAVKEGSVDSEVVTFQYTVEAENTRWGDIIEQDRKLYATEDMPDGDASKVPSGMWIAGIKELPV